MKNTFKRVAVGLLTVGTFTALAGCNSTKLTEEKAKSILGAITYNWDGGEVADDFTIPAVINYQETTKYDISWTSNSDLIKLELIAKTKTADAYYVAKVTAPENDITDVTLTLKLQDWTKDFKVRIAPIDVYAIASGFTFSKDKQSVTADFEVPATASYKGKTADITWSVPADSAFFLAVGETVEGKTKIKVTQSSLEPECKIQAKFSYKGETTTKTWRLTVSKELTHYEQAYRWYDVAGTSINVTGYVEVIGAAWDSGYKNMNLFVVDEDFCSGYYFYRVKAGEGIDATTVKVGSKVTVEGAVSTAYNGLMEASATGYITSVDNTDADNYNGRAHAKAIDELIFADAPELWMQESRYVTLNNWKVTAKDDTKNDGFVTLEKNGKKVALYVSKYYASSYADGSDDQKAIVAAATAFNVNDYVTVTGILSRNTGNSISEILIAPQATTDIVAGKADAPETTYPGMAIAAKIAANKGKVPTGLVSDDTTCEMAASGDGVVITYEVLGGSPAVTVNGNKIVITPKQVEDKVNVKATYKCGTFSTSQLFSINSKALSEQDLVDLEIKEYEFKHDDFGPATYTDITTTAKYFKDADDKALNIFTFAKEDSCEVDQITFDGNKWIVTTSDTEVVEKVVVTATVGSSTASKVIDVKIVKTPDTLENVAAIRGLADKEWGKVSFTYIAGSASSNAQALLTDGTDAILTKNKIKVTTGTTVTAYVRKVTNYGAANVDVIGTVTETKANVEDITFGKTVVAYTADEIYEAVKGAADADAALAPYIGKLVKITGTSSGKYANIGTTANGDMTYTYRSQYVNSSDADKGKTVECTGYVNGINNKDKGQIQFFMLSYTVIA